MLVFNSQNAADTASNKHTESSPKKYLHCIYLNKGQEIS